MKRDIPGIVETTLLGGFTRAGRRRVLQAWMDEKTRLSSLIFITAEGRIDAGGGEHLEPLVDELVQGNPAMVVKRQWDDRMFGRD